MFLLYRGNKALKLYTMNERMHRPCPVPDIRPVTSRPVLSCLAMSGSMSHAHLSISEQALDSLQSGSPEAIIGDLIGDVDVQVGRVACKRAF